MKLGALTAQDGEGLPSAPAGAPAQDGEEKPSAPDGAPAPVVQDCAPIELETGGAHRAGR